MEPFFLFFLPPPSFLYLFIILGHDFFIIILLYCCCCLLLFFSSSSTYALCCVSSSHCCRPAHRLPIHRRPSCIVHAARRGFIRTMSASMSSTPQQRLTYEEISQMNQRKDELKGLHQAYLSTHLKYQGCCLISCPVYY